MRNVQTRSTHSNIAEFLLPSNEIFEWSRSSIVYEVVRISTNRVQHESLTRLFSVLFECGCRLFSRPVTKTADAKRAQLIVTDTHGRVASKFENISFLCWLPHPNYLMKWKINLIDDWLDAQFNYGDKKWGSVESCVFFLSINWKGGPRASHLIAAVLLSMVIEHWIHAIFTLLLLLSFLIFIVSKRYEVNCENYAVNSV